MPFLAVYCSVRLTTQKNGILMLGSGCFIPNLFRILFRTELTRSVSDMREQHFPLTILPGAFSLQHYPQIVKIS